MEELQNKEFAGVDKVLQTLGAKGGQISAAKISNIAKKFKKEEAEVRQRAIALGYPVEASEDEDPEKICRKYLEKEPVSAQVLKEYDAELAAFQVKDLYRFLYRGTEVTDPSALPSSVLLERTTRLELQQGAGDEAEAEAGTKLCRLSRKTFENENARKEYDEFLSYRSRKELLEDMAAQAEGEDLSAAVAGEYLNRLTGILQDAAEAEKLFRAFCTVKSIALPEIEAVTGAVTDVKEQRAAALCDAASGEIGSMDFTAASHHLKMAEELFPDYTRIAELRKKLQETEERLGTVTMRMRTACDEKRYFEADGLYREIRQLAPDYEDKELLAKIETAVAKAEESRQAAKNATEEGEIIWHCMAALEAAADAPEVKELLAKYPPVKPTELRMDTDTAAGTVTLSWQKGLASAGMVYHVVRKEGAPPAGIGDGVTAGRVNDSRFTDTGTEPGKSYYYAVFAERGGVFSEGLATAHPVSYVTEIKGVSIQAANKEVKFSWTEIPENASVSITRQAGEESIDIEVPERTGYIDRNVVNDTEYHYCVRLCYKVGEREEFTRGVMLSATPTEPPQAVDIVSVRSQDKEKYRVEWKEIKGKGIRLYRSDRKPDWNHGDILTLEQWTEVMQSLQIDLYPPCQAEITAPGFEEFYVGAVQPKNGLVVVGDFCKACRVKPVTVKHISMINGKLTILTEPVEEADAFVVLYRTDRYPDNISDGKARQKRITREQFDFDGGLMLNVEKAASYYVSVFTEAKVNGETDYSVAAEVTLAEQAVGVFTYTIASKKKLFAAPEVTITFTSSAQEFELPAIEIRSGNGVIPMYKHSSDFLFEIPNQQVRGGRITVNIPVEKSIPKNTYIKPFLKDESLKDRFQLMSSEQSKAQIS